MNTLLFSLICILPNLQASSWVESYTEAYRLYHHYNAERPLFIVFSAEWCGPCRSLKRELKQFDNSDLFNKYICVMADIDDNKNKVLIDYARKNVPEWSKGPRVPMMMVIGAGRFGSKLGFTRAADIAVWLRSLEPKVKEKAVSQRVPVYRVTPVYRPVYSTNCVTCY